MGLDPRGVESFGANPGMAADADLRRRASILERQAAFPAGVPLVTSIPTIARDGQEVAYLADDASGIVWRFRYRAGSASDYKWEFQGGGSLRNIVGQVNATTGPSRAAFPSPTLTLPLAGEYTATFDSIYLVTSGNPFVAGMDLIIGGTGVTVANAMRQNVSNGVWRPWARKGTAGVTLPGGQVTVQHYNVDGGTNNITVYEFELTAVPVRVKA